MSTLKKIRKVRAKLWTWNITLGDVIALLSGRFCRRWMLKKWLKASGKTARKVTG